MILSCNNKNKDIIYKKIQNNESRKVLYSKMINNRLPLTYNNSRVNYIYNIMINGSYSDNEALSMKIGVRLYKLYWTKLFVSNKIHGSIKNKILGYQNIAYPITYSLPFPQKQNDENYIVESNIIYIYNDSSSNIIDLSDNISDIFKVKINLSENTLEYKENIENIFFINKNDISLNIPLEIIDNTTYIFKDSENINLIKYRLTPTLTYGNTNLLNEHKLDVSSRISWEEYFNKDKIEQIQIVENIVELYVDIKYENNIIKLNTEHIIQSYMTAYVYESKIYINKKNLNLSEINMVSNNRINVTNKNNITVELDTLFLDNFPLTNKYWEFSLKDSLYLGTNQLDIDNIESWRNFIDYI